MRLEPLISHTGILMTFYLSIILDLQNFFHWYILQSWKLKRPQIPLRPHHWRKKYFWHFSQMKMTFQEIRIIATGPCITNQLRDVNTRNERGRFGALKSDSTHHVFRNACAKSGSLRFHSFPVVDWFCLYIYLWVFTFPLYDCSEPLSLRFKVSVVTITVFTTILEQTR
jgi:hypothetical protein